MYLIIIVDVDVCNSRRGKLKIDFHSRTHTSSRAYSECIVLNLSALYRSLVLQQMLLGIPSSGFIRCHFEIVFIRMWLGIWNHFRSNSRKKNNNYFAGTVCSNCIRLDLHIATSWKSFIFIFLFWTPSVVFLAERVCSINHSLKCETAFIRHRMPSLNVERADA